MPKIKLKPNLHGVEIGIGNAVNLKFAPGETVEVAEELVTELLSSGHLEIAEEAPEEAPEEAAEEVPEEAGEEKTKNEEKSGQLEISREPHGSHE